MQYPIANRVIQENTDLLAFTQIVDDQVLAASTGAGTPSATPTYATFITQFDDFVWEAAIATSSGPFQFRINDQGVGTYRDNDRVPSVNFWGTAGQPMLIPPTFLKYNSTIIFELWDTSGSSNTVSLALVGRMADKFGRDRARYGGPNRGLVNLVTPQAGISIGANATMNYSVQGDTGNSMRVSAITATATSASWKARYSYKDPRFASKVYNSNSRLRSAQFTGSNVLPHIPSNAPIFSAGSTVDLDFADFSGSTNVVQLCFIGERGEFKTAEQRTS